MNSAFTITTRREYVRVGSAPACGATLSCFAGMTVVHPPWRTRSMESIEPLLATVVLANTEFMSLKFVGQQ